MKPLVMKFGGTSVGSPEAIQRSARLAASQVGSHAGLVVVVSALSGVTNLLLAWAHRAPHLSLDRLEEGVQEFFERHSRLLAMLWLAPEEKGDLLAMLERRSQELRLIYRAIHLATGQGSEHVDASLLDAAASLGERTCAPIFAALLRQMGIPSCPVDASRGLVLTDDAFTHASVLYGPTLQHIRACLLPILKRGQIPVVTGFIGSTLDGRVTTLGRGASDYSSTLIGASLEAVEIWNWTDVNGVLAADPHLVPQARVIPSLSYEEMSLLSVYGAKVLHPDTVKPVASLGIPLRVRSSFHPEEPGTRVQSFRPPRDGKPLALLSQIIPDEKPCRPTVEGGRRTALITVVGGKPEPDLWALLEQHHVSVFSSPSRTAQGCASASVPFEEAPRAVRALYAQLFENAPVLSGIHH